MGCCVFEVPQGAELNGPVPIGRPIHNVRLYVLDGNLQPVSIGVTGELYIAGDSLARGYHRRPELTAQSFLRDPFSAEPDGRLYRTSDPVRLGWNVSSCRDGETRRSAQALPHRTKRDRNNSGPPSGRPGIAADQTEVSGDPPQSTPHSPRCGQTGISHPSGGGFGDLQLKKLPKIFMLPSRYVLVEFPADCQRKDRPQGAFRKRRCTCPTRVERSPQRHGGSADEDMGRRPGNPFSGVAR